MKGGWNLTVAFSKIETVTYGKGWPCQLAFAFGKKTEELGYTLYAAALGDRTTKTCSFSLSSLLRQ